jgi:hypothetical protein
MSRKKSLLIGINYTGSQHALRGCHADVDHVAEFLSYRGYSSQPRDQVILRDDRQGPYYPDSHNILAAMDWLVSEPNTTCFLHYSGHGGQVKDPDGDRESGLDDTIVPVDFERRGQITSDTLHRHLVSRLPPTSTLFVIFDCCHSGSAIELPFVYRTDGEGNITLMEGVQAGMGLFSQASHLMQGGFDMRKLDDANQLYSGARSFFKGITHMGEHQEAGVNEEHFQEDWVNERKTVTMFSGCRDDQTSADASISGASQGAMSWSFLQVMKSQQNPTYAQVSLENSSPDSERRY